MALVWNKPPKIPIPLAKNKRDKLSWVIRADKSKIRIVTLEYRKDLSRVEVIALDNRKMISKFNNMFNTLRSSIIYRHKKK